MTVKQLIKELSMCPSDAEVFATDIAVEHSVAFEIEDAVEVPEENMIILPFFSECMCDDCKRDRDRLTKSN